MCTVYVRQLLRAVIRHFSHLLHLFTVVGLYCLVCSVLSSLVELCCPLTYSPFPGIISFSQIDCNITLIKAFIIPFTNINFTFLLYLCISYILIIITPTGIIIINLSNILSLLYSSYLFMLHHCYRTCVSNFTLTAGQLSLLMNFPLLLTVWLIIV